MIIWGSKAREKVRERGTFNCPSCATEQKYRQIRVSKYFTLYFIPLFATSQLGEYIKCESCQSDYDVEVLQYEPPTETEQWMQVIYQDLNSGMPLQMIKTKLANQSFMEEDIATLLGLINHEHLHTCKGCQLDFLMSIEKCSRCGDTI